MGWDQRGVSGRRLILLCCRPLVHVHYFSPVIFPVCLLISGRIFRAAARGAISALRDRNSREIMEGPVLTKH